MEPWQAVVALLQGLVEWLPISSEGQTMLFVYNFATFPAESLLTLIVWLHLGTACAVLVRYPREILSIITVQDKNLFKLLLVATGCTAVTAIPLYILLKSSLSTFHGETLNTMIGMLLVFTAIILYLPTRNGTENVTTRATSIKNAAVAGLIQGFAVLPGLSRSGLTISSLLMQRVDKEAAMKLSFLMSVPAVLGIFVIEMITSASLPPQMTPIDLAITEIIVFIVGLASMESLLRLTKRIKFWKLCLVLGVIAIAFGLPGILTAI
ncbi:MAG: undecaprenyl-diphosphate phosphatase [Promethearchaeia archaeon]